MTLTSTQQQSVLFHLGYPGKMMDTGSLYYSTGVMNNLANLNSDTETLVIALLGEIDAVKTRLVASQTRALASQVGDIKLNENEHALLSKEKRRLCKELSSLLDLPLYGSSNTIGLCI